MQTNSCPALPEGRDTYPAAALDAACVMAGTLDYLVTLHGAPTSAANAALRATFAGLYQQATRVVELLEDGGVSAIARK